MIASAISLINELIDRKFLFPSYGKNTFERNPLSQISQSCFEETKTRFRLRKSLSFVTMKDQPCDNHLFE